jgi:hypothetical protein
MIGYDLGMHRAGVLLDVLLLDLVLMMRVLCDHRVTRQQRNSARDYGCKVFSHFVWL